MFEPIIIHIPGEAVPFARAGSNGKRRYIKAPQARFMEQVGLIAARAMAGRPPLAGPVRMDARFTYLRPASHTKKQAACDWKSSKPDASNLLKIIEDALNKIVWNDDAQVADLSVQKKYAPIASVIITISEIQDSNGLAQAGGVTRGVGSADPPSFSLTETIAAGLLD